MLCLTFFWWMKQIKIMHKFERIWATSFTINHFLCLDNLLILYRDIPVEAFNAYCWVHSTYFVTSAMLGIAGINVAFPGVGPSMFYHPRNRQEPNERQRTHEGITRQVKYYQWVPFFLIFQVRSSFQLTQHLFHQQHNIWNFIWQ